MKPSRAKARVVARRPHRLAERLEGDQRPAARPSLRCVGQACRSRRARHRPADVRASRAARQRVVTPGLREQKLASRRRSRAWAASQLPEDVWVALSAAMTAERSEVTSGGCAGCRAGASIRSVSAQTSASRRSGLRPPRQAVGAEGAHLVFELAEARRRARRDLRRRAPRPARRAATCRASRAPGAPARWRRSGAGRDSTRSPPWLTSATMRSAAKSLDRRATAARAQTCGSRPCTVRSAST